tara:strand:- start:139 stop:780 length:642 start_codon:yes stop_codon:yes gene_type:complete
MDNRYENGKIYKIVDNTNDDIYIGSSTESLIIRLTKHKSDYKRYLEGKRNYVSSCDIIKNNDYKIELLELYPCNNRNELEARERLFIENNICVNKRIPSRNQKEYYEINKVKIIERTKQHYIKNKKQIQEYHKEHYKLNREHLKEKSKKYREINKEKIKKQQILYNENNPNRNKDYYAKSPIINCPCGSKFKKRRISEHNKTKKHLNYLKSLN